MSNWISPEEFRSLGYLQEVNRKFLHPLGMALTVRIEDDGKSGFEVVDNRDDLEGMVFSEAYISSNESIIKAADVGRARRQRGRVRQKALGFIIQSVPEIEGARADDDLFERMRRLAG